MAHPSKVKGSGFEREVVDFLQAQGIAAEKVPLSGAVKGGRFDHDVTIPISPTEDLKCECKRRARAFGTIYSLLGTNDCLFVRDDRCPALVVMTPEMFSSLIKRAWTQNPAASTAANPGLRELSGTSKFNGQP